MKEIEILVRIHDDLSTAQQALQSYNFQGTQTVIDQYFFDPLRDDLRLNPNGSVSNSFRIRTKNNQTYLTYKHDHYHQDGTWSHSDEYETEVGDHRSITDIIEHLGLQPLIKVTNHIHIYTTDQYEINLEQVEDLGLFLEVEYKYPVPDDQVPTIKQQIQTFIDQLGLLTGPASNLGKPELLLQKISSE